jgi:hypothetical protein
MRCSFCERQTFARGIGRIGGDTASNANQHRGSIVSRFYRHPHAPLAESPRPARAPIDGRFPGSRVSALRRLPEPSLETASVAYGKRSPLTVAGAAWFCPEVIRPQSVPHSLFALSRETTNQIRQYTFATLACQWSCHRVQASMCVCPRNHGESSACPHTPSSGGHYG